MSIKNYVPIMRPKQGELFAIRDLSDEARQRITPFFDFHRVPIVRGKKEKSLDDHLESILKRICKEWPVNREFFWDVYSIDPFERLKSGTHPVLWIGRNLFDFKMKAIPTIGMDRDDSYLKAIQEIFSEGFSNSLCFRVLREDLETPKDSIGDIFKILNMVNLSESQCHLLLDMQFVEETNFDNIIDLVSEFTNQCSISKWSTFTSSCCGFPINMAGLSPNSLSRVPRIELKLWNILRKASPLIGRVPRYGDYVIVNPEMPDVDPTKIRPGGKIRYATKKEWIIAKGHSLGKGKKYEQYYDLSEKVVGLPEYLGRHYSWGDDYLFNCSKRKVGPGGLPMWIRVDTNHHLTLVGEQISNLFASSGKS